MYSIRQTERMLQKLVFVHYSDVKSNSKCFFWYLVINVCKPGSVASPPLKAKKGKTPGQNIHIRQTEGNELPAWP